MKFIILGCGSSMGVPRPDGFFGNCDPNNKKNYRTRCSALLKTSKENILFDTSPDLRQQLLRHKIKKINKVLIQNKKFDINKSYYVLTSNFLQEGGDKMIFFKDPLELYSLNTNIREVLVKYISRKKNIESKLDNRIIRKK